MFFDAENNQKLKRAKMIMFGKLHCKVENLALKKKLEGLAAIQYKYGVLQLQLQQRGAHLSQAFRILE